MSPMRHDPEHEQRRTLRRLRLLRIALGDAAVLAEGDFAARLRGLTDDVSDAIRGEEHACQTAK